MIKINKLNCGIRVVMDKVEHLQSVSIGIWVKAGAVDEEEKYAGVSHYIEHMMFKGTKNRTAQQIAEDIDKIGGQINAFTSKEATCYYVKSLATHIYNSADVLIDMLTESLFDKVEMNRERKVILEEIKMSQDTPDDVAQELITKMVNSGNPIGKSIIGTPTTLKNISRNVMTKYIEDEYTRDSIVIAIAGNFDEDAICEYIENKFNKFKTNKEKKEIAILPYEVSYKTKVKEIEQAHLFLGTPSMSIIDQDYYKMSVFSSILGGNMSSRLFQSIREQKGLAYTVYCINSSSSFNGSFYIYAGVAHENIKNTIMAIKEELLKVAAGDITENEISKAKEQLKSGFIFGQENVSSKMFSIGRSLLLTDRVKNDTDVLEAIDKVTLDDINMIASKFGDIEKYSACTITNKRIDLKKYMKN